jgi:hypothetical protein
MDQQLVNTILTGVVVPALLTALLALLYRGLALWDKHSGLTQQQIDAAKDSSAGQALTNAVTTFAGMLSTDIQSGKLTLADVKDGQATKDLLDYLNKTVSGAMLHFNKPPEDLNTMLVGALGAMPVAAMAPGSVSRLQQASSA